MYDTIIVPTDGDDIAERAASLAISLAERFDARLLAISVATPDATDRAERAVGVVVDRAEAAGVDAAADVLETHDAVHLAIIRYAEEHDADSIVMGTHGRTGVGRFLLGSVATRTLQESTVPVITVHEETATTFDPRTILVPTDGSAGADAAADYAIDLARATGATLHVLHVLESGRTEIDPSPVDAIAERAADAGLDDVETVTRRGRPHLEIAGYSAEIDGDCIVMGTHGRTGLRRYLLGSVTERTVRFATVPVVAVRPRLDTVTVEYLDYAVVEAEGWSLDDDLFERAAAVGLDAEAFGSFEVDRGEFILDAAEAAGLRWPYYCRVGGCVNCVGVLVEGEVEMERCRSLSEEEQEEHRLRLTCVATPTTDTVKLVYNAQELDFLEERVM